MTDRTDKTAIGDRMKAYEAPSTSRKAFKGQPLVVRLDGNNFHTFTKGLKRPYDVNLSGLMVETTKALVDRFHCKVAYTQSDEITLIFTSQPDDKAELLFDGRFQKIETLTAAYATAYFNKRLEQFLPQKVHLLPCFDSRAYIVPNLQEAYHVLLWRQQDATKNAVSMGAQALYSQKELNGKNGPQLRAMMLEKGVDFDEYPYFFKRGTFVKRIQVERALTAEELAKIPEAHQPKGAVSRNEIRELDMDLSAMWADPIKYVFGDGRATPFGTFEHLGHVVEIYDNGNPIHKYEWKSAKLDVSSAGTAWNLPRAAGDAAKEFLDIYLGDFIIT